MSKIAYTFLLLCIALSLPAQDAPMRVERSGALEWGEPVRNIHVDADNRKWVSSTAGLFIVYDTDVAEPAGLAAGQQSLLQFPGGNADIRWTEAELTGAIGDILDRSNYVSAAYYDEGTDDLWLGTSLTGVFRLRTKPSLQLVEQMTSSSSKLRSNEVNDIFADVRGRIWIATNDGVLMGAPGKWDVLEKNLVVESITGYGDEVWFMGDGLLGPVNRRDIWSPIRIPDRKTEGAMRDISFDAEGRLWIASEVITCFEPGASEWTVFGPAQEYTSQFATFVKPDLDGTIWIGTRDKGLYRIGRGSGLVVDLQVLREATCERDVRDGALKVVVAGGEPPYAYNWNASLSGDSPQGLQPGTYQVTVSDSKGQTKVAQAEIADPRMTATVEQDQPASPGGEADGQATVYLDGGRPDFRFRWDNGETTPQASQLTAGAHTVTVTDANNCTATAAITISQEAMPLEVVAEVAGPVQCKGEKNAVLRADVSGGKGPYAYQWSLTSINKSELPGVGAGEYTVTVTDADNNQAVASVSVADPVTLTATGKVVQPVTPGAADGQATVEVSGGEGTYSYRWDNGATTREATGLNAGYHTVTVTDELGCEATSTFNVPEEVLPLQVSLEPANDIGCNGGASASLTAQVQGGKAPFQYAWSDPTVNGAIAAGLGAGPYTVTVTDAAGQTQTAEVTITEPPLLEATAAVDAPASTGGADGQATVEATGGTPPYRYDWGNGETSAQATALPPGEHTVLITDAAGCEAEATVEITEDILPLQVSLTQTEEIDCNGASATLSASVRGGKGPFEYAWSDASGSGETASNLSAGAYSLTVTDATGQTQTAEVTINQPDALQVSATVESPASTGSSDGSASVRAQGGTGAYTYAWDNGETAATATGLAPGAHTVTVTDENGCTATAEVAITEDILPLQVSLTQTEEIDCNGASATLSASVRGGKGPFEYAWSDASGSGETASNLSAGAYSLTVTDATGQTQTAEVTINQPDALQVSATVESPASTGGSDGSASVRVQGGTGAYTYAWDNGETAATATGLAPGAHTVTVTDENGCTATAEVEITEDILPLQVSLTQTEEIDCNGGASATLSAGVRGGKGPFEYAWSEASGSGETASNLSAGAYSLTVTDATGQTQTAEVTINQPDALQVSATVESPASTGSSDGSASVRAQGGTGAYTYAWDNGETAATATGLAPGAHTVTVTDENGCTATAEVAITEDILPLQVSLTQTEEIDCNGGASATLSAGVRGGKGPFEYAWSDASGSGETASNLSAGAYSLTVTDATGQTQTAEVTINQPDALQVSATVESPASTGSSDGSASVRAQGGTGAYTYAWDNGETAATATGLAPGVHTVTVTDENGCTATAQVEITEDILPLQVSLTQTGEIDCSGGASASLSAGVRGGKGPFEYAWSDASGSGETASNLRAGAYSLTVTDATGQTQTAEVTINQPDALQASATVESPASTGGSDGSALVRAQGGTGAYTYAWDNGETAATATGLAPGAHTVTVTDENGCTATAEVAITEDILPLQVSLTQTEEIDCSGGASATLSASVRGGKGPFEYVWSDASGSGETASNLSAGAYSLTVTDATGQTQTAEVTINQPDALQVNATVESPASTGSSDGSASVRVQGGTGSYSYSWDNGENGATAAKLAPGTHTVTVTDENGCTATAEVDITENILPLQVSLTQTQGIDCNGGASASLSAGVRGGKGPFTYTWSDAGLSGESAVGLSAGEYSLTVSDVTGQTQTAQVRVSEPEPLLIAIEDNRPASTEDTEDGSATVKVTGGTGRYTYAWDNGANTPQVDNLPMGTHGVTVTDENGCTASAAFETAQKTIPELTAGRLRSGMTIQMQKLQFEADSTRITEDAQPILDEVYQFLKDNPSIVVEIGGHTNNLPPAEYCDWLSTERAKAVAEYLVIKGLDPNRVAYKGYGKREPLFSNQTADGRRRNQRVEIKILQL